MGNYIIPFTRLKTVYFEIKILRILTLFKNILHHNFPFVKKNFLTKFDISSLFNFYIANNALQITIDTTIPVASAIKAAINANLIFLIFTLLEYTAIV